MREEQRREAGCPARELCANHAVRTLAPGQGCGDAEVTLIDRCHDLVSQHLKNTCSEALH